MKRIADGKTPDQCGIHLSIVATSRNDDHGGSLLPRMQHFIDGLVAQCKRHRLRAELILVEWNPPADRPPLLRALRWPSEPMFCDIRIVTVPPELHARLPNADKIRLFQMIAKNVAIRRARGAFVLATNIDVLFSDGAMEFMRDRLRGGVLYLADRSDVPADVPRSGDFSDVLRFCGTRQFRINGGSVTVMRAGGAWRRSDLIRASVDPRVGYLMELAEKAARNPRWLLRRMLGKGMAATRATAPGGGEARRPASAIAFSRAAASGMLHFVMLTARAVMRIRMPFTNACGDFTLMAREDWLKLRGYVEWPIFSLHLDSLLVYQAVASGIRIKRLGARKRVFHIDHGEGFSLEAVGALLARLRERGVPFLTDEEVDRRYHEIMKTKKSQGEMPPYNEADWGLAGFRLPETRPGSP